MWDPSLLDRLETNLAFRQLDRNLDQFRNMDDVEALPVLSQPPSIRQRTLSPPPAISQISSGSYR